MVYLGSFCLLYLSVCFVCYYVCWGLMLLFDSMSFNSSVPLVLIIFLVVTIRLCGYVLWFKLFALGFWVGVDLTCILTLAWCLEFVYFV